MAHTHCTGLRQGPGLGLEPRMMKFYVTRGGSRIPRRRGRQPSGGAPTYDFVKFSEKLHEIEKILDHRGGARRVRPPKSATGYAMYCTLHTNRDSKTSQVVSKMQETNHFIANKTKITVLIFGDGVL